MHLITTESGVEEHVTDEDLAAAGDYLDRLAAAAVAPAAEKTPVCPICGTGRFMGGSADGFECAGCANRWTPDGAPTKPVTLGYRQPRLNVGSDHDRGHDGHKPSTTSAVWVARDVLRAPRPR